MKWPKLIANHLRGSLEILDDVHAEPDELFKIGVVISRLENAIQIMEEGGKEEQKVEVVDGASSNERPS
jgi:hypothetical protein